MSHHNGAPISMKNKLNNLNFLMAICLIDRLNNNNYILRDRRFYFSFLRVNLVLMFSYLDTF